jgi:hypothetical protein
MKAVIGIVWVLTLLALASGVYLTAFAIRRRLKGDQSKLPKEMAAVGGILLTLGAFGLFVLGMIDYTHSQS